MSTLQSTFMFIYHSFAVASYQCKHSYSDNTPLKGSLFIWLSGYCWLVGSVTCWEMVQLPDLVLHRWGYLIIFNCYLLMYLIIKDFWLTFLVNLTFLKQPLSYCTHYLCFMRNTKTMLIHLLRRQRLRSRSSMWCLMQRF